MSFAQRAPIRAIIAVLLAAACTALSVGPAHAAAYRFWGFYQLADGQWAFAQKGSDQIVPKDGSVDGWRYAVADVNDVRFPRATLTFEQLCASTPAETGKKRVGLVIDYGRPADSADGTTPPEPTALCAVVAPDATTPPSPSSPTSHGSLAPALQQPDARPGTIPRHGRRRPDDRRRHRRARAHPPRPRRRIVGVHLVAAGTGARGRRPASPKPWSD